MRASEVGQRKAPIVKSKKPKGTSSKFTRNTRHSKRISQKNDEVEDSSEKSMNMDLLHMIDTMSFQPASNTGTPYTMYEGWVQDFDKGATTIICSLSALNCGSNSGS